MSRMEAGPPNYPNAWKHHGGYYRDDISYLCWICHLTNCYNCGTLYQGWQCEPIAEIPEGEACVYCRPERVRKTHELKITPKYFEDVARRSKRFEVRKNDRGFQILDRLLLREWDGEKYTGHELLISEVSYLQNHADFPDGIAPGYCILGFSNPLYERFEGGIWRVID